MRTRFLKNYTSDVPVSQTIGRIEHVLIKCGVSGIMKEYGPGGDGKIEAITFQIEAPGGKVTIRLPAKVDAALESLWLDYVDCDQISDDGNRVLSSYKKKRKGDFKEQAERTAWRIIQDWIEVQMSCIQLGQAETLEVFLPYLVHGKTTFYQSLKEAGFAGLLPEKAGQ